MSSWHAVAVPSNVWVLEKLTRGEESVQLRDMYVGHEFTTRRRVVAADASNPITSPTVTRAASRCLRLVEGWKAAFPSASRVHSAYRFLVQKFHPDVNPGREQEAKRFVRVQTAFDVLSDPQQRARYDSQQDVPPIPKIQIIQLQELEQEPIRTI
jgi:hypothetical protein